MLTPNQTTLHPTTDTFEHDVVQSDLPVLIDFWAPWCPPCRMLKPELERLAEGLAGKARIAFINVDEQPALAEMFGVQSIPALVIMKHGRPVDAWTGYAPRAAVLDKLQPHIE